MRGVQRWSKFWPWPTFWTLSELTLNLRNWEFSISVMRVLFMCHTIHIRRYNVKSHWKVQGCNSTPEWGWESLIWRGNTITYLHIRSSLYLVETPLMCIFYRCKKVYTQSGTSCPQCVYQIWWWYTRYTHWGLIAIIHAWADSKMSWQNEYVHQEVPEWVYAFWRCKPVNHRCQVCWHP